MSIFDLASKGQRSPSGCFTRRRLWTRPVVEIVKEIAASSVDEATSSESHETEEQKAQIEEPPLSKRAPHNKANYKFSLLNVPAIDVPNEALVLIVKISGIEGVEEGYDP